MGNETGSEKAKQAADWKKSEKEFVHEISNRINKLAVEDIRIMEVCGTHTHQIARLGIKKLLSPKINLVSGPGCPVCVTESTYIDAAIGLLEDKDIIIATFGDILRVRGTKGSLQEQKSEGKSVILVYSPEEAIALAIMHKDKKVVFLAVGFETTAPLFAVLIKSAKIRGVDNLFFLTSLKRMEPVIQYILDRNKTNVQGMLCPGHVAAVTGIGPFSQITEKYGIPAVICGFEAMDILAGVYVLMQQIFGTQPLKFQNLYKRCVKEAGNITANNIMNEVYCIKDGVWRGIGTIKKSALKINAQYEKFNAEKEFNIKIMSPNREDICECSDILLGTKTPVMCRNFGSTCTPDSPLGPCMVSSEGACAAYFSYEGVV